jgi:hypothetical protein
MPDYDRRAERWRWVRTVAIPGTVVVACVPLLNERSLVKTGGFWIRLAVLVGFGTVLGYLLLEPAFRRIMRLLTGDKDL